MNYVYDSCIKQYPGENKKDFLARAEREMQLERDRNRDPSLEFNILVGGLRRVPVRYE